MRLHVKLLWPLVFISPVLEYTDLRRSTHIEIYFNICDIFYIKVPWNAATWLSFWIRNVVSSRVSACCRKRLKTESTCKISFESIRPLRLCARVMKCVLRGCVIHPRLKTFPQTLPTVPVFCLLRGCYRDSWAYPFLFLIFSFFTFYSLIPPSRFSWLVGLRAHPDCFFLRTV